MQHELASESILLNVMERLVDEANDIEKLDPRVHESVSEWYRRINEDKNFCNSLTYLPLGDGCYSLSNIYVHYCNIVRRSVLLNELYRRAKKQHSLMTRINSNRNGVQGLTSVGFDEEQKDLLIQKKIEDWVNNVLN